MSELHDQNEYNDRQYDPAATPSTEAIRATYATDYYMTDVRGAVTADERAEAFDRWLAAHDAEVRSVERERAALHAEEGYRMEERCDDIAKRIRSGEPAEIAARPGVIAEEPERPLRPTANASDYEAGMRWMCDDSSVWETRWDAREQQWAWGLVSVPVRQEGADDA